MYFFVNTFIAEKNSGIEYSQIDRAKLFEMYGMDYRFLLLDDYSMNNFWMNKLGIDSRKKVINLYDFYTNHVEVHFKSVSFKDVRIGFGSVSRIKKDGFVDCYSANNLVARIKFFPKTEQVSSVEYFDFYQNLYKMSFYDRRGFVRRIDHFSPDGDIFKKIWVDDFGKAKITEFLRNGHAYSWILYDKSNKLFEFDSVSELRHKFINDINNVFFESSFGNVFINDRTGDDSRILFDLDRPALPVLVLHNCHTYNALDVEKSAINMYYAWDINNANKYSSIICSTKEQVKDIKNRFLDITTPVIDISAGIVFDSIKVSTKDRFFNKVLITARVSEGKNIDKIVKAIGIAKKKVPDIGLDIYGLIDHSDDDKAMKKINKQIMEYDLQDLVNFCGFTNEPLKVQSKYSVYALLSSMEGFNISLMQALSNGCIGIVTDVKYGPSELVIDNENGYLIDNSLPMNDKVNKMADFFVDVFSNPNKLQLMSNNSYKFSKRYDSSNVIKKWQSLDKILRGIWQEKIKEYVPRNVKGDL